ncbi:MAG: molybdopterin-synthase adenylyltransferase MoeB [Bacillota bacterium]
MLSEEERARYARQLVMPNFGEEAQEKLAKGKVLVVGAGGLGSPVLLYLAAAGVGRIGVVDPDSVDLSNLQRQVIHDTASLGYPKVHSAANRVAALNPHVRVESYRGALTRETAFQLVSNYDVVVNCVDNLSTRYQLNDVCVELGKPLVEAGVMRYEGMATTILPGVSPCYRCVFPVEPREGSYLSPSQAGVLGVTPGVLGTIQAAEAIKLLTGLGKPLAGRLLLVDLLSMDFRCVEVSRASNCSSCGWIDDLELAKEQLRADPVIAVAAVKSGRVLGKEAGRRLAPLLVLEGKLGEQLEGAVVADKVVGLAAAKVAIARKVRAVYGEVMSQQALNELRAAKVAARWGTLVPAIKAANGVDPCPMEQIAQQCGTPQETLAALRKKLGM